MCALFRYIMLNPFIDILAFFLNNNKSDCLLFTILVIKFQTKLLTELIEL